MNQQVAGTIAFSIDSLKLGGAERTLLRWAVWCRDAGWRVVVITRHGPERDAYPVPEGVVRRQEPSSLACSGTAWLVGLSRKVAGVALAAAPGVD